MKVLLINKYYYIKGGTETYFFGVKKMLEEHGHKVMVFSMKDDKNYESSYSDYFVGNKNYEEHGIINKAKNSISLINSKEAYDNLSKLIEHERPDIAHVNLIYHHLTPSIFHVLKKYKIPIIFTSHDYKMICPNYKLYNGEICTKCYGGKFYNCTTNKCHKDSLAYSFLMSLEAYYHKYSQSYELIDRIIAPSNFMRNQLVKAGIEEAKISVIHNFISAEYLQDNNVKNTYSKEDRYFLYFGRLSEEKGVINLLKAKLKLDDSIKVKIVGGGPEREKLEAFVLENRIKNVDFLGFKSPEELKPIIENAYCTIISSVWHEVFGLTVVESFAAGTPVIGTRMGGIQELIKEGLNGYLYNANDFQELSDKINEIMNLSNESYFNLRHRCKADSLNFNYEKYYDNLLEIYEDTRKKYSE